jgi:hypothetical protein
VLLCVLRLGEKAGGFNHNLDAQGGPIKVRGVLGLKDPDRLAIDRDAVSAVSHLGGQDSEYRVVLQQMSQGFRVSDVVDRYEFNSWVVERPTQQVPSNASKAIDSNLNRHK